MNKSCQVYVKKQNQQIQTDNSFSINEKDCQTDDIFILSETKTFEEKGTQTIENNSHDKESQTIQNNLTPTEWNNYFLHVQSYYKTYYQNAYFNNRNYYKNNNNNCSI
jgi:hypothetical protein